MARAASLLFALFVFAVVHHVVAKGAPRPANRTLGLQPSSVCAEAAAAAEAYGNCASMCGSALGGSDCDCCASGGVLDCSGMVQCAYGSAGFALERTTWTQWDQIGQIGQQNPPNCDNEDWSGCIPGDLFFYSWDGSSNSHVAMYIGDGYIAECNDPDCNVKPVQDEPSGMAWYGSGRICEACGCWPGQVCGDDSCGNVNACGTCGAGQTCSGGQCVCAPQCDGRDCGPDQCGGTCGNCPFNWQCAPNQRCQSPNKGLGAAEAVNGSTVIAYSSVYHVVGITVGGGGAPWATVALKTATGYATATEVRVITDAQNVTHVIYTYGGGVWWTYATAPSADLGAWATPAPLGFADEIDVTLTSDGNVCLFVAGGLASTVYLRCIVGSATWSPTASFQASSGVMDIAAAPNAAGGSFMLIYVGYLSLIGVATQNSNAPASAWTDFGLGANSPCTGYDPRMVANADGRLEAFWIDTTHERGVWHAWQGAPGVAIQPGSCTPLNGTAGAQWYDVAPNADGRLELVYTLSDGSVWHTYQLTPGSGWSDVAPLVVSPPAWLDVMMPSGGSMVAHSDGTLEVVVVAVNATTPVLGFPVSIRQVKPSGSTTWTAQQSMGYYWDGPCC